MTPGLAIIAAVIFLFGVALPVASMIADEHSRSTYGAGAARRYLAALVEESTRWPGEIYKENGVSVPPWVALPDIGSRGTAEWKADMARRIAAIAPDDVSIVDGVGTCIHMKLKDLSK